MTSSSSSPGSRLDLEHGVLAEPVRVGVDDAVRAGLGDGQLDVGRGPSRSSASASHRPASAWRARATFSGRAGTLSQTSKTSSSIRPVGPRGAHRLLAGGEDGEHREQAGDLEDAADGRLAGLSDHQGEARLVLACAAKPAEQHAEDRRVDERRRCQVDDDGVSVLEERRELLAERGGGVHVVLAVDDHDRHAVLRGVNDDLLGVHAAFSGVRRAMPPGWMRAEDPGPASNGQHSAGWRHHSQTNGWPHASTG